MNARTDREHLFTVALFFVFVAALLLALLMGTGVYRRIHAAGAASGEARLAGSLVANIVRSKDAEDSVRTEADPEGGDALVLTEHLESGTFETRLYLHEGSLVEEYVPAGTPYDATNASVLATTNRFDVELNPAEELVVVTTDEGTTEIALRSGGAIEDGGATGDATDGAEGPAAATAAADNDADAEPATTSATTAASESTEGGERQ